MWNILALGMASVILGAGTLATTVFALFSVLCFLVILFDSKLFNGFYSGVKDPFYLFCEFVGMVGNLTLLAIL